MSHVCPEGQGGIVARDGGRDGPAGTGQPGDVPRGDVRGTDGQVHRISEAPVGHALDLESRMRRYLLSMALRTVCAVLAVLTDGPVRWICVAGAVLLPSVAVLLANAGRGGSRRPSREDTHAGS